MGKTWELLDKTTLSSNAGVIRVPHSSGDFALKDRLYFEMHIINDDVSKGFDCALTFNGDDAGSGDYGLKYNLNGASTSKPDQGNISYMVWSPAGASEIYVTGTISNIDGQPHLIISTSVVNLGDDGTPSDSLTLPNYVHISGRWDNTDQIKNITLTQGGGDTNLGEDSTITVFGNQPTAIPPDISNGSVFITSDTNVHYMFNSSAGTWNEVA